MSILKHGKCDCQVIIASIVYVCNSCGYREIVGTEIDGIKKCSKCGSDMSIVSSSFEQKSSPDNS